MTICSKEGYNINKIVVLIIRRKKMKKAKFFIAIMICTLLLGGCGESLNKKETKQLKENAKIYCDEVHKRLSQEEKYSNAVLLEAFVYYIDIYDNSERPDAANVYSKYQLADDSIIYFNTMISEMVIVF